MVTQRNVPDRDRSPTDRAPGRRDNGDGRMVLREAAQRAVREFADLVGKDAHGVTGARRTDDGWSVLIDVVELDRIPQSTSLLATYRVDIDDDGRLVSYERLRRFTLGATDSS